jgi:hypothetical protein
LAPYPRKTLRFNTPKHYAKSRPVPLPRMGDYLLYQAYGSPAILHEALLSILSYLRQPAGATVLVYTDNPAHFRAVLGEVAAVEYVPIEPAQWQAWRGEIDFVHRVKIKVLQHAAAHYVGNLLYVDTDTIFLKSPADIFAALGRGEHFMHVAEGRLGDGNPLNRKINRALRPAPGQEPLARGWPRCWPSPSSCTAATPST